MKKKIVLFLCIMGIMAVLTGCASSSKEIYTPQNIQEKKAKKERKRLLKQYKKEAKLATKNLGRALKELR